MKPLLRTDMLFTSKAPHLLKIKAHRKKEWFTALSFEELVVTELIIKHIRIVRNPILATVVARIIKLSIKLIYTLKNSYFLRIERIGKPIAISISYGNRDALNWIKDKNLIRYLGLISYSRLRSGFMLPNCYESTTISGDTSLLISTKNLCRNNCAVPSIC